MNEFEVVYVIGPYRAATEEEVLANRRLAERAARWLWRTGHACLCPHTNSGGFEGEADDDVFLRAYLQMMDGCDVAVVLPGWERSRGSQDELRRARLIGMPVRFLAVHPTDPQAFILADVEMDT